jgi:ribosomal subunit interface protein
MQSLLLTVNLSIRYQLIMDTPLQITFRNIPPSDAIEADIRKRAAKLDQLSGHVMRCRVTVEAAGKHKQQGRLYEVRIDLTVPGAEIAISHGQQHDDVYVAIRDAFDAAARKLEDTVRCQRGDVKVHEVPGSGA